MLRGDRSPAATPMLTSACWPRPTCCTARCPARPRARCAPAPGSVSATSEVDPAMQSYALNANGNLMVGDFRGVAVRTGTRWRRPRGNGNAVANRDRVVADENLLDEESHDPLPLKDVERLRATPAGATETPRGFQPRTLAKIVCPLRRPLCYARRHERRNASGARKVQRVGAAVGRTHATPLGRGGSPRHWLRRNYTGCRGDRAVSRHGAGRREGTGFVHAAGSAGGRCADSCPGLPRAAVARR